MQQLPANQASGRPGWPAEAIRAVVVPQVAPPFDDDPASLRVGPHAGNDGPRGAAARPLPGLRSQRMQPGGAIPGHGAGHGASPRGPDGHGAVAAAWPRQFAQVLAETLAGSRSQRQLVPWTTEQVRRQIRELGPLFASRDRPLVRRVMTAAPASGVIELTAVVGFGSRIRVLALRLEREPAGRAWCCTAFEPA